MLEIEIPGQEYFDERTSSFIVNRPAKIQLEHSLLSVSNWEAKWKKPFLDEKRQATYEESVDYIRCMTLTKNVDPSVYYRIPADVMDKVDDYISDKRTATWFSQDKKASGKSGEKVTSELIYYWMISHNIPFECQKWHLNRLLTLIRVCNIKSSPPKKMSKREAAAQRKSLNAQRRANMRSRG